MGNTNIDVCSTEGGQEKCRVLSDILTRIGDKWTVMVVGVLSKGSLRYSQIFKSIDNISQRMLTLTLKNLECDGLVSRQIYPTVPPRVDYTLTALGQTLIAPLETLLAWAQENKQAIAESRASFKNKQTE